MECELPIKYIFCLNLVFYTHNYTFTHVLHPMQTFTVAFLALMKGGGCPGVMEKGYRVNAIMGGSGIGIEKEDRSGKGGESREERYHEYEGSIVDSRTGVNSNRVSKGARGGSRG